MKMSPFIAVACLVMLMLPALAQGGSSQLEVELQNTSASADEMPTLTVRALAPLRDVTVVLKRSDDHRQIEDLGSLAAGESSDIAINQPGGSFRYDVQIRGLMSNDEAITMDFDFQATVSQPLEIELLRDQVDLDAGKVPIEINQPVDRVDIEILDGDNRTIVETTQSFDGARGRLAIDWDADEPVGAVRLTIHYGRGAWYEYVLEPFWIEIPEQIINFETGSATLDEGEEAKLEKTASRIREALETVDDLSEMQLYVAGYTDTVGSAAQNRRLSTRRARSLGQWFKDYGIALPIYYQGFGQEALAVSTPDETAERRNRRAVYILGNAPPPTSDDLPHSDWRPLR